MWDLKLHQHICAVLVQHGIPVAVGYNNQKTTPKQENDKHSEFIVTTHAEVAALTKAVGRGLDMSKCELLVLRLMKRRDEKGDRAIGMAKPCHMCENILKNHSLKGIYYTAEGGVVSKL